MRHKHPELPRARYEQQLWGVTINFAMFVLRKIADCRFKSWFSDGCLFCSGINCSAVQHTTGLLESARDAISQLALPVLIMPNLK